MKKGYYGWRIVIVGFFMMAFLFAPIINLSGVFIIPLTETFAVPRSVAALVVTIATALSMVVSLFAGKVFARFNLKKVVVLFLLITAAGCLLCAGGTSLAMVFIGSALRGIGYPLVATIPLSILISNWFGPQIRGRAWAVTTMGSGVGVLALSPLVGAIIENWGWRWGYAFYALLALVMIPCVVLVFVQHPKDKGLVRMGEAPAEAAATPEGSGIAMQNAARTPMLWLFFLAFFLLGGSNFTWNISGASYLRDIGFPIMTVSLLLSLTSVGITVSKFIIGTISDKFSAKVGFNVTVLALVTASLLLIFGYALPLLAYPGALLMGFGLTVLTITPMLMIRDLFGDRDYGVLLGFAQSSSSLGSTLLPLAASAAYELSGSYIPAWSGIIVLGMLALACVGMAYRMKPAVAAKYWQ